MTATENGENSKEVFARQAGWSLITPPTEQTISQAMYRTLLQLPWRRQRSRLFPNL